MPFDQRIPHPFTAEGVQSYAPVAPGVYGISNAREWIYVGQADDIQRTLLTHLQDAGTALMKHQPAGFVFEICQGANRTARQDRLVFEYEPACNRRALGTHNARATDAQARLLTEGKS